jgi:DNA-directed RNA polymerase subunit alpha
MNKFKVTVEEDKGNRALVSLEPLEQGYGHTLGNSLRRVLLSSLPGVAITAVKISGVSHQFSTIPGVIEDAIQIILNLKKVRIKIYGDKPIRLTVNKTGEGVVTAADIDTQGLGEVVNKDQYIATITEKKATLSMEMTAESGVGYAEIENKKGGELGSLQVDAIFTPVLSVNYTVDQTRVGRRTDFDKLTLDVITDGTILPLDAVNQSAQILAGYFKQVFDPSMEEESPVVAPSSSLNDEMLKASVEELDLPVRITNALKAIEIDTIGKLLSVPRIQLMKAKNLGAKSITLISEKLAERGLSLGEA